jgi:LytS/YehU family sensor histidine kinase
MEILLALTILLAIAGFYFAFNWKKSVKINSILITKNTEKTEVLATNLLDENKSLRAENNALKLNTNQFELNAHLFKNALNKLKYSADKSHESFDLIISILNYVIYDSNKSTYVNFIEEFAFLRHYIKFYETTFDRFTIELINHIEGKDFEFMPNTTAPMLTTYFVENAFKHGLINNDGKDIIIELDYDEDDCEFIYTVTNKIKPERVLPDNNGGKGKANLEDRLNILYPDRYSLSTAIENGKYYICKLTINFENHGK